MQGNLIILLLFLFVSLVNFVFLGFPFRLRKDYDECVVEDPEVAKYMVSMYLLFRPCIYTQSQA